MSKLKTIAEIAVIAEEIIEELSCFFKSSVSKNFYTVLNEMTFLNSEKLSLNNMGNILDDTALIGKALLNVSNLVIWAILLIYAFKSLFSYFMFHKLEVPWQFFLRMVIFFVIMNSSYYICYTLIYFTDGVSSYIREFVGEKNTSFEVIEDRVANIGLDFENTEEENDIFEMDDLLKMITYVTSIFLLIYMGIRFILLKLLIIFSPIFFAFGGSKITEKLLLYWLKLFSLLLIVQIFTAVTLNVLNSLNFQEELNLKIALISVLIINIQIIKKINLKSINVV